MNLPIFKYFYKSSLRSKFLWITNTLLFSSFVVIISVFTFSVIGNSDNISKNYSIMAIILFLVATLNITSINAYIFNRYFAKTIKDNNMGVEIRSGLSKHRIFLERILLSKVWSIGFLSAYILTIVFFGLISSSRLLPNFLFNLSIGFLTILIYDLFITGVFILAATYGSNLFIGLSSGLLMIASFMSVFAPAFDALTKDRDIIQYNSQKAFRDYEDVIIAKQVGDIINKYNDKPEDSFVYKLLNDFSKLSEEIEIIGKDSEGKKTFRKPASTKETFDFALSGLLVEINNANGLKNPNKSGEEYKFKSNHNKNNSILVHFEEVKELQKLENPYNKDNDYGKGVWTNSIYFYGNRSYANEKHKLSLDGKNNFNDLLVKLKTDEKNQEKIAFYNLVDSVVKNTFVKFSSFGFESQNQRLRYLWYYNISDKANANGLNDWLENVNISLGARLYQTATIKILDATSRVSNWKSEKDFEFLNKYYNVSKKSIFLNPWLQFNKMINYNYVGDNLLGNKFNQESFNKLSITNHITNSNITTRTSITNDEQDDYLQIFDLKNLNAINMSSDVFNPYGCMAVYLVICLLLIGLGFYLFKIRITN